MSIVWTLFLVWIGAMVLVLYKEHKDEKDKQG